MAGDITLAAAFVAGVSGSMHCMTMCGGLSSALGMRARAIGGNARAAFMHAALYQIGRLSSYALAGALCGWFGSFLTQLLAMGGISRWLRVAAGVLMILMGLQVAFAWRLLRPIENLGAQLWRKLSPLTRQISHAGAWQSLGLGLLWGWLPCGLVYSMLLLGVLGGNALQGAWLMLIFGLGTLPAMFSSTLLAAQLGRLLAHVGWRLLAGTTMLGFGLWTAWVALQHHAH